MHSRFVLAILLLVNPFLLNAQSFPRVDPKIFAEQIVPNNPDVAILGRYSMSPPSFSNGLPQQNIPLFEIKEDGITYPVSMYYSYSGFRVKEDASSIGLGWGLTEGMIMRIVKHLPDESPNLMKKYEDFGDELEAETGLGYLNPNYFTDPDHSSLQYNFTLNRLFYKLYDAQPDLYVYNFNGYKGKFFWINGQAIQLEHNDLLIEGQSGSFIITTPDGNKYTFDPADNVFQTPAQITRPTVCYNGNQVETYTDNGAVTAWRLKEIKNTTTQAKITFKYIQSGFNQLKNISQATSVTFYAPEQFNGTFLATNFQRDETGYSNINNVYYSQEIESDNYKVIFNNQPRSDGGTVRISGIQIYNKLNLTQPAKTITFTQEYFGDIANPMTCWLKLKKVNITGGGTDAQYKFTYVNESSVFQAMDKTKLAIDHWGYYNAIDNQTLVPLTGNLQSLILNESNLNTSIVPWANRDPAYTYARSFALETVYYPTGGFTRINYQSAWGKGIRVTSQEDNDGKQSLFRYYDYGDGNTPPNWTIPASYFPIEYYTYQCCGVGGGPPMTKITTYGSTPDGSADDYGETDAFNEEVTEFIGTPDGQGGRSVYKYQRLYGYGNEVLLAEKTDYKYGSSDFVHKEKYTYTPTLLKSIPYWEIPTLLSTGLPSGACHFDTGGAERPACCPSDPEKGYILGEFSGYVSTVPAVWTHLDKIETTDDQVTKTVTYNYHPVDAITGLPKHTQSIEISGTASDGTAKHTYFYYPGETDPDNSSVVLGVPQMWQPVNYERKNFIGAPIKVKVFIGSNLVSKETSFYTYDAVHDYILKTGYESLPTGLESGKVKWSSGFDKAKIVTMRKTDGIRLSYIWDYNNQYPIAEVTNCMPDQAAYTSFESIGSGNWSIGSSARIITDGITGRACYQLSNGAINTAGMTPDVRYILSYWSKNGSYSVSGGSGTVQTGISVDGWTFYKHVITASSSTIGISGTGLIDELRLYPETAQMTTYTYDPLTGKTSQCDMNNRILFYEYDGAGRLTVIRDMNKKVMKKMEYQLQPAQ